MIERINKSIKAISLFAILLSPPFAEAIEYTAIRTLNDMVQYVGLTEVYVAQAGTGSLPGFFVPVSQFQLEGVELQNEDGSKTNILDSFAYYIKYGSYDGRPKNYEVFTNKDFTDEKAVAGGEYSCLFDTNMIPPFGSSKADDSIAKYDVLAINQEDPKRQSLKDLDIDSLTTEEAKRELFQFTKGFRLSFLGGSAVGSPEWPDTLVNICLHGDTGTDSTTGLWSPKPDNIFIIGDGTRADLTAGWNNEEDKAAGKKADLIYLRGVTFQKIPNPKLGTGLVHNADILLKLYHKAGVLSDEQFEKEIQWYETQSL